MTSILLGGRIREIGVRLLGPIPDWLANRFHTSKEPLLSFAIDWIALAVLVGMAVWLYRRKVFIRI